MNEREINKKIARQITLNRSLGINIGRVTALPDYCNNWDDLMKVIVDLNVDFRLIQTVGGWLAVIDYTDFETMYTAKTQQLALANVLLKLLEHKYNALAG